MPKMPFIPDRHSVETLPAKRPYQPLDVRRRIGRAKRNRYSPDVHFLPQPFIECWRINSDLQSLQIIESNDQNRRSLFRSEGFFDLLLYTASCCRNARIRTQDPD
jgi:hypothetical protein